MSNENMKMLHVGLKSGEVGEYVFLPGSPERSTKISKYFDNPKKMAQNREHLTYTGYLDGVKVSVTSTGMGGPSTAIVVEELAKLGAKTFIRVGTCASTSKDVEIGDVVIPNGAVKMEGTSSHYIPVEYPAVPDYFMLKHLEKAAINRKYKYIIAPTIAKDSFYTQTEPETKPVSYELINKWQAYEKSGAKSTEMESATLFAVSSTLKGCRAATVLVSATNYKAYSSDAKTYPTDLEERAILTAIDAMKEIIKEDLNK
ncbi:nucleoside phosphorylase [Helcococcus kunzii]|uniref:nucleoside phosphorylase n=1 Tax=Helcococcus kunzii TaxID=40091 RepID=UPI00389BAD15